MTQAHPSDWTNDLMADAGWSRRLAASLLGDASAADDARHEAWLAARGAPPAPDLEEPRSWMRTVLANTLRSRRRSELRRRAREKVSAALPDAVATPEELLARLEVQKTLATLVTSLAEPARQMVLLRFFEGLTSAEIGAAIGAPAGTVRWRLKAAIDELREGLERRYGAGERDWRLALLPLLPRDRSGAAPPARPRGRAIWGGVVAAGAILGIGALAVRPSPRPDRAGAGPVPAGSAPGPRGGGALLQRPGGAPPVFVNGVLAPACDAEIAALTDRLEAARAALAHHLPPQAVWDEAGPEAANEAGAAAAAPAIKAWLDDVGAPREGRKIECRRDACRVKVDEAWPVRAPWIGRAPGAPAAARLAEVARDVQREGPQKDFAPSGVTATSRVWLRLHAADGSTPPAPVRPPPLPPELAPSGEIAAASSAPAVESCGGQTAALSRELAALRLQAHKLLRAPVLFAGEPTANPALAARLQTVVDRAHAAATDGPEADRDARFQVACRGLVCKIEPRGGRRVRGETLKRLFRDEELQGAARRVSLEVIDGDALEPLYVSMKPAALEGPPRREGRRTADAGAGPVPAIARDLPREVAPFAKLPPPFQKVLAEFAKGREVTALRFKRVPRGDHERFDLEFLVEGQQHKLKMTPEAEILETEVDLPVGALPPAVRSAVEAAVPGGAVVDVEREQTRGEPAFYEVDVRLGGRLRELHVSEEGRVLRSEAK
jgi:RNA polymerase sigma-70 factor (ECF subfamily)